MLDSLFARFDSIIVFDIETTGIDHKNDEIIELAALQMEMGPLGAPVVRDEFDLLIRLSPGRQLPAEIVELTHITPEMLETEGVEKSAAAARLAGMLESCERPLLVAYNAQFDLCFVYYFLAAHGQAAQLKRVKMLDALTVYKDRRPYPHKLFHAIEAYGVEAENTHRAIDDTKAAFAVLCAMERECADLEQYINLFGYNPKYGVSGPKISSIRYVPQPYRMQGKLYEQ